MRTPAVMRVVDDSHVMKIHPARHLSDATLVTEVDRLAGREREATVAFIVHLAEFDARRLYAPAGFPSTFAYCVESLHLSEDAAFNRIEVARLARAHPAILDMLVAGRLSPTTARMRRRYVTEENHERLLAAAAGQSKGDLEKVLAGLFPHPDVPASIRRSPPAAGNVRPPDTNDGGARTRGTAIGCRVMATADAMAAGTLDMPPLSGAANVVSAGVPGRSEPSQSAADPPSYLPPQRRPAVRPLSSERYEIRFTVSGKTREKLRRAQDLLAGCLPSGDV